MKASKPLSYSTYAACLNVIDMLNMRGYNIDHLAWVLIQAYGTAKPFVPHERVVIKKDQRIDNVLLRMRLFEERLLAQNPGKTLRQALSQKFIPRPGVTDRPQLWVAFVEPFEDKGQVNQGQVQEYINQYIKERNTVSLHSGAPEDLPRYMFVTTTKLSSNFAALMAPMTNIEFWREEQLLINPYRHILSPRVRPATAKEIESLKIDTTANPYLQTKGSKIKLVMHNDAAVRWMNYPLGGVYYWLYFIPVAGTMVPKTDEFRLVVPPTGKELMVEKKKKVEKTDEDI